MTRSCGPPIHTNRGGRVAFALMLTGIAVGIVNIAMLEAKPPNAGLPLVHSDFPVCVTVRLAPLLRTPNGRADFRFGQPSNDRGVS